MAILAKKWNIKGVSARLKKDLLRSLAISPVVADVLINRGVNSAAAARHFLEGNLSHLADPSLLPDAMRAAARIQKARARGERVMVYGDYDVDGITGTAILKLALSALGLEVLTYLPHRIEEGYGLNKDAIDYAHKMKVGLLVTVDCGVTDFEEVAHLNKRKIDVIITDHHEPLPRGIPPALAIINPKRKDSSYPYRELSGAGVALRWLEAVFAKLKKDSLFQKNLDDYLALATLGTVADVVPLTGENRILVKEGLPRLERSERIGIRALIRKTRLEGRRISSHSVAFILGPRMNACGRISTPETSLRLILSETDGEAEYLADTLERENRHRQKVEAGVLREAFRLVEDEVDLKRDKAIVLSRQDWHPGVIGIIASRILERFYRPTILISERDGLSPGSGRSVKNFHLKNALEHCRELLDEFGGHEYACGLKIKRENIANFRKEMCKIANARLKSDDLIPQLDVDSECTLSELLPEVVTQLSCLSPFGKGNPQPNILSRRLRLKGSLELSERGRARFWVTDGNLVYEAAGFGMGQDVQEVFAKPFDMVYSPTLRYWRGRESIRLQVRDFRPAE